MSKEVTEMVFILDRSGSMRGMEDDTIGGYNSMIEKSREGEGTAIVSTVLFDDKVEVLKDRVPIEKVSEMTKKEYYVRGCTALLDAVGGAIHHIKKIHKAMEKNNRPDKTVFVITTDGLENASKKYSYEEVKKLITKQKEKHEWEFLFLGADFDAVGEAAKLGIDSNRSVRFVKDSKGMNLMYATVGAAISNFRASNAISENWAQDIVSDYDERK